MAPEEVSCVSGDLVLSNIELVAVMSDHAASVDVLLDFPCRRRTNPLHFVLI